jgi:hypothetical protein
MGRGSAHSPLSTEEIEKKLNIYHKGAKIWKMLIFCQVEAAFPFLPRKRGQCGMGRAPRSYSVWACPCGTFVDDMHTPHPSLPLALLRPDRDLFQGGPGHLYLLKNKVATFAKVEKEEDMIQ